jgi:NDP-sugar pyrophosphorylase family protein
MKAIIMAAGRGSRLKELTHNRPKALVPVLSRPVIEYTFDALPDAISEVIYVVGYKGDAIRDYLGAHYRGRTLSYVTQTELRGTADALWKCKDLLTHEDRFLVMNGDDIYSQQEIAQCIACDRAFAYIQSPPLSPSYLSIDVNELGNIAGASRPKDATTHVNIATGVYVLTPHIFQYQPVQIASGELGLPQTILAMTKDYAVRGVEMKHWHSINSPEDIAKAEERLRISRS